MKQNRSKKDIHNKRTARIRAIIRGSSDRPRLSVFRSNTVLTAQIIDDDMRKTIKTFVGKGKNNMSAKEIGINIVSYAKEKHINRFVFDRGGYKYHGVIKTLADTVREGGVTI